MWKNIGVMFVALAVLFVSLTMAGLRIWAQEDGDLGLRNNPIEYKVVEANGDFSTREYRLPEVSMLPSSPFYGFKQLRDWMWIQLTSDPAQKAKVVMLIADKKMMEGRKLFADNLSRKGLEASIEAVDKLKYAQNLISNQKKDNPQIVQIKKQILEASYAYKEILLEAGGTFEMETDKYEKLIKDITDFNETQKETIDLENN